MKRYSISYATRVNEKAAKSGIAFQYAGRTDNPAEVIESYKNSRITLGLQITDSETKTVIFSDIRPIRGKLIYTLKHGDRVWKVDEIFVNLSYMREREHNRLNEKNEYYEVIKVEREIYR